jgi:hypothetical protein
MKGVELPVNTMIVIALGFFVLILVAFWLVGGFKPLDEAKVDSAVNDGCNKYAQNTDFLPEDIGVGDINNDGKADTLLDACRLYMKKMDLTSQECIDICVKKFRGLIQSPAE